MTISVEQQTRALIQTIGLGVLVGLLYDLMRILRVRVKVPGLGGVLDFGFWTAVTVLLFIWSQRAWNGAVRLYGAAFLCVGGGGYFWIFSRYVLSVGYRLADVVTKIIKVFTFPLVQMGRLLKKT